VIVGVAVIAQLAIVARAPDAAGTCDAVEISVAVTGPSGRLPQLTVPSFAPFDVLRSSAVPHVTYDTRGRGTLTAEYQYVLTTDQVGMHNIEPFEARVGGATARSRAMQIDIHPGGRSVPTVVARARVDTSVQVNFRALTTPETVFVGQQANYEVAVFLNAIVRDRLRRNPTFFPPDMQSMLAYDLPTRGDPPRRQVGSHCFDALVYQRALFPLMPGRFAIPPAQLVYSLPLSSSFFSREESHELQTDTTVIFAVEPPMAGRPSDYGGAVGNLHVNARLDTNGSRVGDPIVLTVRVSGTGNVKLFPRPSVGVSWATLVKGDERVQVDTSARRIGGSKEFDWVLTPRIAGELDVPPIRYSYFNPESRRYEVAMTRPTHVRVRAGTLASADTTRTETQLSLRTHYRGSQSPPFHELPIFWAFLALVPVPALSMRDRGRPRRRGSTPVNPAARLLSLVRDRELSRDASEIRRAYTNALADRLRLDPESFTRAGGLARGLRRRGVTTTVALDAEQFLRDLDEAAFSDGGRLADKASERAARLYRSIDDEALPRTRIRTRVLSVAGLFVLGTLGVGAASLYAYDEMTARDAFERGVNAYQRHDFMAAREAFVASVAAGPRAPDAWANLGTASWAVADTARGVAAWQRALRLEPLASDVRDRAEMVHALPWTSTGYVPPLPAPWLFNTAALLWCAAWGVAAYRAKKGRAGRRRDVTTMASVAAIVIVFGLVLSDRLAGRQLAVMRHTASLNVDPQFGAERGATAIIGEVVRVSGRQGAWCRVVLDDGRDGWIENTALISLDVRDASDALSN
jgi:hypothetical protein